MKIADFTAMQLDVFRKECNFTDIESRCFELKAKDRSDVQLAMELNVSESTIAVTMRRVRNKIDTVLRHNAQRVDVPDIFGGCNRSCPNIVYHTMAAWSRIPDFLSSKGTMYIYADYRTENINGEEINIPRIKIGDGINSISKIPFVTMSITDEDMELWDGHSEQDGNDFGNPIEIDSRYSENNKFIFPTDGYLMLKFENQYDHAKVNIYGAGGKSYFVFEKPSQIDIHSKEVFVRKGMKCEFVKASVTTKIQFVPLI